MCVTPMFSRFINLRDAYDKIVGGNRIDLGPAPTR